jgi:glutamate synthase domain-containing protein 2
MPAVVDRASTVVLGWDTHVSVNLIRAAGLGAAALGVMATRDVLQRRHAITRNFPVIGHLRFALERIGPELRQYIVTSNDGERPFSRDQRSWVYASSKLQDSYVGFGTDNNIEDDEAWTVIKHRTFSGPGAPTEQHGPEGGSLPAAKVLGGPLERRLAFRPASVVNISGMSFGSLSRPAIEALNIGARLAGCWHNTGEGALAPHHRQGGDLVFQIGTAYFGCRDAAGEFALERLVDLVASAPVRAIEIKLSQGAKPGLGGMLPAAKVTAEIAEIRGIPAGVDCASPSRHTAFGDVDSMLDFVETIADATGLPVGIKSAVGNLEFWDHLAAAMAAEPGPGGRGVDFVNIDGGEGGTGAAPPVFSDSVAYPFRIGFAEVYKRFAAVGLSDQVFFTGAGKLGLPENAMVAFALGCDSINVGREAMFALGCVQAQRCHSGHCPTGVATQNLWLQRGLDVPLKAERVANYVEALRREILKVSGAVGVEHPSQVTVDDIDIATRTESARSVREVYGYGAIAGPSGPTG